mgnify:CR=1 FL=1
MALGTRADLKLLLSEEEKIPSQKRGGLNGNSLKRKCHCLEMSVQGRATTLPLRK